MSGHLSGFRNKTHLSFTVHLFCAEVIDTLGGNQRIREDRRESDRPARSTPVGSRFIPGKPGVEIGIPIIRTIRFVGNVIDDFDRRFHGLEERCGG